MFTVAMHVRSVLLCTQQNTGRGWHHRADMTMMYGADQ